MLNSTDVSSGPGSALVYSFRHDHIRLLRPLSPVRAEPGADGPEPDRGIGLDALIVPSHSHPDRLPFAADLARRLGCLLLVTCVQEHVRAVLDALRETGGPAFVLAAPWPARIPLPDLATSSGVWVGSPRQIDVAAKRNVGLVLARLLGWERILFLDDDIRGLTADQVRCAVGALRQDARLRAVAWRYAQFPDNSVVCHARRTLQREQGVFAGGGALLVDVAPGLSFFPGVYNEDWLFQFDLLADDAIAFGGDAEQLPIDPFGDPDRAADQEFGDILGEGLFHLLHVRADVQVAFSEDYWRDVVRDRRRMVGELLRELLGSNDPETNRTAVPPATAADAVRCLRAALDQHTPDLPSRLASFTRQWRHDHGRWRRWFEALTPIADVDCPWPAMARVREAARAAQAEDGWYLVSASRPARVDAGVRVRRLTAAEWPLLQRLRLAALADARTAFLEDPAQEVTLSPERWRARCRSSTWFVAERGSRAVGLAALTAPARDHPHLESMWVEPSSRGLGVAAQLVRQIETAAIRDGAGRLGLWVFDSNPAARGLYEHLGYRPLDPPRRQPLSSAPGYEDDPRVEEELQKRLPSSLTDLVPGSA